MKKHKNRTLPLPLGDSHVAPAAPGGRAVPADQPVRDRLLSEFDRNFLVEAGAGSGKTYSLAMRMAAGVAAGHYTVDGLVAVTFTRKAAAELRGRFQIALEELLRSQTDAAARQRLTAALAGIERLFSGTIHAFCSHLLRERPVDARIAPGFTDLDDVQNLRMQREAWRDYVVQARATGFEPLVDLLDADVRPNALDDAFGIVCEHEDVEFDTGAGQPPDARPVWKAVDDFWRAINDLRPDEFHPGTTCGAQKKFDEFDGRLRLAKRSRVAALAGLLTFWGKPKVTQKFWGKEVGRDQAYGVRAKELVENFQQAVVEPFLNEWRAYVHGLGMRVLIDAREFFARERRRQNAVNYVDLLRVTAAMLKRDPGVRRSLQQKYRWLFVDEFQDTDPLQAEIFLMLAADERAAERSGAARRDVGAAAACDPFTLPLRPGALFVVGDPKQSIYRFRRADIDIYNRVAVRIRETGGAVVSLTANFRSLPSVCDIANAVFPDRFREWPLPYSPAFEPLDPVRSERDAGPGPRVAKLTVPEPDGDASVEGEEARLIASYIRSEVAAGRRKYGDFLVLTRQKPRLRTYAGAFDALEVPVEVSGAGLFCKSSDVRVLAVLLAALADPLDSVSLVGVLRGPLFGLSDPDLFQFRQAGGRFEITAPLPEAPDGEDAGLARQYGPALAAMRRLREMLQFTRRLPLASAAERILQETGWAALAATTPGGARAGHLLQAIDRVRQVAEDGGGLLAAASALNEEEESAESEALPLEPGRRDVVRLMNLHKAKGLEAPVVFLADPAHAWEFPIVLRILRDGETPKGHLKLVASTEKPWNAPTLGAPHGWDAHEAEERQYREAEKLRLLYVACTRAKDLLVVGRLATLNKNKAWGAFEGYLAKMPELVVPAIDVQSRKADIDLSATSMADAAAARSARHEQAREASWQIQKVTEEKAYVPEPEMPSTPSHRADAGVAWGSFMHGLLEHAVRHRGASRADLERLARWLTVEHTELRPFVSAALDVVTEVMQTSALHDALASGEAHVEVPFAVRVDGPGDGGTGPAVLRGVIDLAYRADGGWRILDYKTDQIDGQANVGRWLLARHGPQLDQYRLAWQQATGDPVSAAGIVSLRAKETFWPASRID